MANLTQVEKEVKARLQEKVVEIKEQLPHRYLKLVKEKMEAQKLDLSDRMVYAVVNGQSYNKELCVILIQVAKEYQESLKTKEEQEEEMKLKRKAEIQAAADAEMKKLGL
ncbi:MAG: hypothetical protein AAF731_07760 [Bacteroidota bacterium]